MVLGRICYICALFLLWSSAVTAHELYLKNGTVIKTDFIQRHKSHLTYRQFGGDVTIPLSEVEKIQYTERQRPIPSSDPQLEIGGEQTNGAEDLRASLESHLNPQGPIETANLSVVSIQTASGSGTGFFINDNGLIITNRHVVRGSERNDRSVDQALAETERRLEMWRKKLKQEKSQLDLYQKNLKQDKAALEKTVAEYGEQIDKQRLLNAENQLKQRLRFLKEWQQDYNKRRETYLKSDQKLDREINDLKQNRKALSLQSRFTITLADGENKSAVLYRVSDSLDLALLKLNGYKTPYLEVAEPGSITLGQQVFAIGSPLQLKNSVTSGVISNFRGEFIQTNAEIYPGNSGGPLVTEDGQVIGINSMKLITNKFEGIGFAIDIGQVFTTFPDFFSN